MPNHHPADIVDAFFAACKAGDTDSMRALLARDEALANVRSEDGFTPLHAAVQHADAVRLLLAHGADPNARDTGDNALPLHGAAGHGSIESVRALLDGGSDVQGTGDAHAMDVIGWATLFADARRDVVDLLVERGAKHHVFTAAALGDIDLLRRIVADDASALQRRLSRSEQEQTALHYVVAPGDGLVGGTFRTGAHYDTLRALLELGADLEARDAKGRTALEVAMLRGDIVAMRILHEAGARPPQIADATSLPEDVAASVQELTPMLAVADVDTTVRWYRAIGFELVDSHDHDGRIDFAYLAFGNAALMFVPAPRGQHTHGNGLSLWIRTDRLDALYAHVRTLQVMHAHALLKGATPDSPELRFTTDLYTAFYGQREFGIRDPNGIELMFNQPVS
jgi:ankyrin repeat protein/uncharacterized glyoxalase superfamily protein PhnB